MDSARAVRPDDLGRCAELLAEATERARAERGGRLLTTLGVGVGVGVGVGGPAAPLAAAAPATTDPGRVVEAWAHGGPDRTAVVGTFDGAAVGLALGSVSGGAERVGRVDLCYVEPGARGVGVGSAMVGALLDWFDGRQCTDVDALALPGDRATKQLFEAAGFKARLLVLHRRSG